MNFQFSTSIFFQTRSLALEWGEFDIRVVGIAPGPIAKTTGLSKLAGISNDDDISEIVSQTIPLKRLGTTKDVALLVIFLCSNAASFITGDTIIVDGGAYLFKPQVFNREAVQEWSRDKERAKNNISISDDQNFPRSRL